MNWKRSLYAQLRKIKRDLVIRSNRFRMDNLNITFEGLRPKITINDRHEKRVKAISRAILFISVVMSFISLPFPFSAGLSLSLIALEQIIERFVYSFVSAAVLIPFPDFELWSRANFAAVVTAGDRYLREPSTIGMYFRDEDAGKEVFRFINLWAKSSDEDLGKDSNVRVSFVIHPKKNKYAFFVMPNFSKEELDRLRQRNKEKLYQGKEPHVFIGAMIMCKLFNYKDSGFEFFRKFYKVGHPYKFTAFSGLPDSPKEIPGIRPIMKNYVSILTTGQLTGKHVEKFMCDYNVDWDDGSPVPKSLFYFK